MSGFLLYLHAGKRKTMLFTHVEDRGGSLTSQTSLTQSPLADILALLPEDARRPPAPASSVEFVIEDAAAVRLAEEEAEAVATYPEDAPQPPPGARVYLCREDARECGPGDTVFMWCWERGPRWFYAREHAPPPTLTRKD